MVLEVLAEIGEGREFEAWVGEGEGLLGEGDFVGEVFHKVNAGDEEEGKNVEPIGALGSTLLAEVQNLLMKGMICAFELGVEELGVG